MYDILLSDERKIRQIRNIWNKEDAVQKLKYETFYGYSMAQQKMKNGMRWRAKVEIYSPGLKITWCSRLLITEYDRPTSLLLRITVGKRNLTSKRTYTKLDRVFIWPRPNLSSSVLPTDQPLQGFTSACYLTSSRQLQTLITREDSLSPQIAEEHDMGTRLPPLFCLLQFLLPFLISEHSRARREEIACFPKLHKASRSCPLSYSASSLFGLCHASGGSVRHKNNRT